MSVQATSSVWDYSEATGADLIVMLSIADAANADGRNAHPGMKRLTSDCRKDPRAVLKSIEHCISRRELCRVAEGHRGQAAAFDIVLPRLEPFTERVNDGSPIPEGERVNEFLGKGEQKGRKGWSSRSPLPNNQQPLGKSTKSKTQKLRQWEQQDCPKLHCNRVTAFCEQCARQRRKLVA